MTNENKRKIVEYRLKHPRCKYCKLKEYIGIYYLDRKYQCLVDKKIFKEPSIFYNIRGCFCDYFEVDNLDD